MGKVIQSENKSNPACIDLFSIFFELSLSYYVTAEKLFVNRNSACLMKFWRCSHNNIDSENLNSNNLKKIC